MYTINVAALMLRICYYFWKLIFSLQYSGFRELLIERYDSSIIVTIINY